MHKFHKIFKKAKSVIGVIHFPPLLGCEGYPGFEYIKNKALKDLESFEKGGVDGILLENNYDIPHKISVDPETIVQMTLLAKIIRDKTKLPLGIIVLFNDYKASLAIAKEVGAQFIRLPVFVDYVETDFGKIKGEPEKVISYQKKIGAEEIAILIDIQVKHSRLLEKKSLASSAKQAIKAGSDGLIITGKWTGDAPQIDDLERIRKIAGSFPIIIGSGITENNVRAFIPFADGFIVSTSLKGGEYLNPKKYRNLKKFDETIDRDKVRLLLMIVNRK